MGREESLGWQIERHVARRFDGPVPSTRDLPRPLSVLPQWLENVAFRLVWPLVGINLLGTAFGFFYYTPQLAETPLVMWPIVPVSPLATLYFSLSLACWRLGYDGRIAQIIHVLAFIGCLKYGFWAVFVQLFVEDATVIHPFLWQFLIWSHLGMALQAFLVPRYATFSLPAVSVGVGWYVLNDVFDYVVDAFGGPHHTWLNVTFMNDTLVRPSPEFELMMVSALVMTLLSAALSLWAWRRLQPSGQ